MADKKVTIIYSIKDRASKGLSKIGKLSKNLAIGVLKKLKLAFIGIGIALAKLALDSIVFQREFTKVKTLLDESSFENVGLSLQEGLKFLKKDTLDLMKKYGLGIEDVNKALFDTVSAGIPASKSIEFLDKAVKLSIGGVTSLSVAVDGITSIMNAYKLEVEDTERIANAFFTAQKFGKTTVEDLANNIGKLAPVANSAGVSFEELLAASAQLTLGGLSTEEATTSLRAAITSLISPAKEARDIFDEMGIPYGRAAFEGGKLGDTLEKLSQQTSGNIDVIAKLIPNIRALTGITSLNEKSLESYRQILNKVRTDTVSLNKAYEEQTKTFAKQFDVFIASFRTIAIVISNQFLPSITKALKSINEFLDPNKVRNFIDNVKISFINFKTLIQTNTVFISAIFDSIKSVVDRVTDSFVLMSETLSNLLALNFTAAKESALKVKELLLEQESEVISSEMRIAEIKENAQKRIDEIKTNSTALQTGLMQVEQSEAEKLAKKQIVEAERVAKEKERLRKEELQNSLDIQKAILSNVQSYGDENLSIVQQVQRGILDELKKRAIKEITLAATAESFKAKIKAFFSFGSSLLGLVPILAAKTAGIAAVNSIQLAEGGIVKSSPGGTQATIGEAGRDEAVIPLDSRRTEGLFGGPTEITLNADGVEILAKAIYQSQTELIRNGQLTER
jgi:TP901 family phage tail tape measure protein